jgi:hypothetical protein
MSEASFNIVEDRENFLQELRRKVESAYSNRVVETPEMVAQDLERRRRLAEKMMQLQEYETEDGEFEPTPNQVWVDNPHDYHDLFRMGLDILVKNGGLPGISEERLTKLVEDNVRHEFQHHVPVIGQPDLKVHYLLTFYQTDNGSGDFAPSIQPEGKLTKRIYFDMAHGPDDPSEQDIAGQGNWAGDGKPMSV